MMIRCLAISICAAGLALAQSATTPAPGTPPGPRGRGGFGRGGDWGPGGIFSRNGEARLTKQLGLNATQQNTLHTALMSAEVQRKGLNEQARSLRTQLSAAVKAGNEGQIESITRDMSALQQQETSIHARTLATVYGSLTADQKTKFEPMMNRELGVPGPRPAGRGPLPRRPNAQPPAAPPQ